MKQISNGLKELKEILPKLNNNIHRQIEVISYINDLVQLIDNLDFIIVNFNDSNYIINPNILTLLDIKYSEIQLLLFYYSNSSNSESSSGDILVEFKDYFSDDLKRNEDYIHEIDELEKNIENINNDEILNEIFKINNKYISMILKNQVNIQLDEYMKYITVTKPKNIKSKLDDYIIKRKYEIKNKKDYYTNIMEYVLILKDIKDQVCIINVYILFYFEIQKNLEISENDYIFYYDFNNILKDNNSNNCSDLYQYISNIKLNSLKYYFDCSNYIDRDNLEDELIKNINNHTSMYIFIYLLKQ